LAAEPGTTNSLHPSPLPSLALQTDPEHIPRLELT
jgi:hypothetical protein